MENPKTYLDICKKTVKGLGLNPDDYTDEQIELIAEPINAPENFAHDGELTPYQQKENWLNSLKKLGLSPLQRTIIQQKVIGL